MRGCVVNGCLELAKWVPIVKVKLPDNDNPMALDFNNLCICDTHKNQFTLVNIVTDTRLTEIQTLFKLSYLTQPLREHMELTWGLDTYTTTIPLFDSSGKPLSNVPVVFKDKGIKI